MNSFEKIYKEKSENLGNVKQAMSQDGFTIYQNEIAKQRATEKVIRREANLAGWKTRKTYGDEIYCY